MSTDHILAFQRQLESYVAENFPKNICFSSCLISESAALIGAEVGIVKRAVPKRIQEFSTGRHCARRSLNFFGIENSEILQGRYGEPIWPQDFTGSITHHSGIAVAVAMPLRQGHIGIDLVDMTESLESRSDVLTNSEVKANYGEDYKNLDLILFSMKESLIKVLSPMMQEYVEFRDIQVECSENVWKARFKGELLVCDLYLLQHGQLAFTTAFLRG